MIWANGKALEAFLTWNLKAVHSGDFRLIAAMQHRSRAPQICVSLESRAEEFIIIVYKYK